MKMAILQKQDIIEGDWPPTAQMDPPPPTRQTVSFREASTIDVYMSQLLLTGKSRLNFYPRDALLARSLLQQHVCPSVAAGTVSKRIKISSSFFLSLVAPPHRISNTTLPYLTLPYHSGQAFYRLALRPPAGPMRIPVLTLRL